MRVLSLIVLGLGCANHVVAKPNPALARITPVVATEPVPVIDFFRPYQFDDPEVNSAGTRIAALYSAGEDKTDLVVIHLDGKKPPTRVTGPSSREISWFRWADEQRLFFTVRTEKHYSYGLFIADVLDPTGNRPINAYDSARLIGIPKKNPLRPVVWIRQSAADHGADAGVVQFDATVQMKMGVAMVSETQGVRTNDGTNIVDNFPSPRGGDVVSYFAGEDGELAFGITAKNGLPTLHRWVDRKWQKIAVDLDEIDLCSRGEKPGELLVLGPRQEGKPRALQRLDTATGKLGEVLHQDDTYDISPRRFHFSGNDGRLLGVNCSRLGPETIWFDPAFKQIQAELDRLVPGWTVQVEDMDKAGRKLLLRVTADRHPGRFFIFDVEKHGLTQIGSTAPWIDPARMRPMRMVTYKSRDGRTLDSYVTVPVGVSKEKPAPLVVLPHGGPWVRDTWGWDPEAQFLASRGYIVFQPNYRGSSGYGWRFTVEDEWNFKKMHEDVTDGVQAFLKSGLVDRDRVAIMGASFGAYLALCGAVNEPGLYRCAVGIAGVYDWEQVLDEARGDSYSPAQYGFLKRHLGDPKTRAEQYESISPLRHVDRIKVPVFVAHGRDDKVASVAQSKNLIRELKRHNVPNQVQLEYEEGHGFQQLENRIELYTRIEVFLATNLASKN